MYLRYMGWFFCVVLVLELILLNQLLHVVCTLHQNDILVDDKAGNSGAVHLAHLLHLRRGVANLQKALELSYAFADVHIQVLDILLGKNLFHRWAAASCSGAVQNDLSHTNTPFCVTLFFLNFTEPMRPKRPAGKPDRPILPLLCSHFYYIHLTF